jgi:hypothetical protein
MMLSDEILMAYADGELDAAMLAQVTAAVAADPALAARVAVFVQSREAVAAAFARPPAAPVPDPIADRIRALAAAQAQAPTGDNVVTLAPRRQVPFWQLPLAASIALIAGLAAGQFAWRSPEAIGLQSAILSDRNLFPALEALPSGRREALTSGAEVALIASFRDGDGRLCREFEYDLPSGVTTVAVACRAEAGSEAGWQVKLAIAADAGSEGYAPASSLDALDAWLVATGTEAPMTPEQEAEALKSAQ